MQQEKQEPTLVINGPDGSALRIYQDLPESYVEKLVDASMKRQGVVFKKTEMDEKD